jgi:hypothetical protein
MLLTRIRLVFCNSFLFVYPLAWRSNPSEAESSQKGRSFDTPDSVQQLRCYSPNANARWGIEKIWNLFTDAKAEGEVQTERKEATRGPPTSHVTQLHLLTSEMRLNFCICPKRCGNVIIKITIIIIPNSSSQQNRHLSYITGEPSPNFDWNSDASKVDKV